VILEVAMPFDLTTLLEDYLDELGHPAVTGIYDTFRANIEDADPVDGIKHIRKGWAPR